MKESAKQKEPKLSVILICKNQAWNIERLIESVIQKTACVSSKEIVLVDSYSADRTTELASNYPITILRLHRDQTLSAAAGRYVGYQQTTGEYVLFLDGDMELCDHWLIEALRFIKDKPEAAAVTGIVVNLEQDAQENDKPIFSELDAKDAKEIPYGGGAALYRRSVLEQVGTFNPYIYSDEEPELCIRIRGAGYKIFRLKLPIAFHYSTSSKTLSSLVGRWRRSLYLGAGQNLRYHLGTKFFWPYFKERAYGIVPALGMIVGIGALALSIQSGQTMWLSLWMLLVGFIIVGDAFRKQSLYRTLVSLLERLFIADGTIRGFMMKPLNPNRYPGRFEVIKSVR